MTAIEEAVKILKTMGRQDLVVAIEQLYAEAARAKANNPAKENWLARKQEK